MSKNEDVEMEVTETEDWSNGRPLNEEILEERKGSLLDGRVPYIDVGMTGTIATASYENWKPAFYMRIDTEGMTTKEREEVFKEAKEELRKQFRLEKNNCKAEVISERFENIGFSERNGLKYVWITSVLGYDIVWRIPEFELTQYGSRGTIVHEIAHDYIRKIDKVRKEDFSKGEITEWKELLKRIEIMNPEQEKALEHHVAILLKGNLGLHWNDCSVIKFLEAYADKITNPEIEVTVWNDEHLYTGRMDMFCGWEGIPTIVDYKCGVTSDFRQLAAGAVCRPEIRQMVIAPVGPTDNKAGYMKPKISTDIAGEFKLYVKKRHQFRKLFGI